jgi:lipoprotein NlpD
MTVASAVVVAILLALSGCANFSPAPVAEPSVPVQIETPAAKPSVQAPPSSETRAGYYTVRKGDTLYRIALEHGQDYKDLVAWNSVENPNRIEVGQQLRVIPPEGQPSVAVVKPVVSSAPVEAKSSGANTETYKREPRGGKQPYSEQALAKMREGSESTTEQKPPEATAAQPKPASDSPLAGDDAIEWAWPSNGKLVGTFSDGGGGKEAVKGIDLAGKAGDPVQAAAPGKVVYAGSGLRGYGNLVIVRHNATYLSAYAHNSKILVKEGQSVTRGQKIAEVGNSDSDQAKLHFEIRRQGKPVDPQKYLPAR